jgi:alpha-amylase
MKNSFVGALIASIASAGSTVEWKQRSVYQVLTDRYSRSTAGGSACSNLSAYCGGTFNGIKNNLDYIKNMGFETLFGSALQ